MPELPTGTVTFLFSDIEGSTLLLRRLGADYARVLVEYQALLRASWAAHDGFEVDTEGDSFFVAFASAPAALAAAVGATRALAAHAWPDGTGVRVRIGLHTGTPQLAGNNYIGLDVHRAARISAAGHGGQILLSAATRALVADATPAGAALRDLGPHRLKDLPHPQHLFQLVLPDLPADFPPLKSLDARPHNLPLQPTPMVGREAELTALTALLRRGTARLVTLTGPGGMGKTRLAIQVAAELLDDFADGVWFVRLSRLTDPSLVVPTIAQTLGLREVGSESLAETLRAFLADKRLLLVLDNFEQVVGASDDVAGLLAASPGLTVLVTSRIRLHLRGEREYPLAPLPLPEPGRTPPERLSQFAAVALFVERAGEARPDFAVTTANAPAVAEICARLDGLPLAIELAAARVKILPPEALLARLSTQLHVLTGGARDLEERQRTMRATIAWSEDLLEPELRTLFRRLAVFVGGCSLEAAETICAAPQRAAPLDIDVLDGLGQLVDQSLVQQREEGGEPRFGMLHVIREYALERLEAAEAPGGGPEAEALRRAHAAYFLAFAERAEPQVTGPEAGVWLAWLEREHDNLRAALGWARDRGQTEIGLRLAASLGSFWAARGHLRDGRAWLEDLLAVESAAMPGTESESTRAVSAGVRARAFLAGGALADLRGDVASTERWLEAAATLGREAGDARTTARALNTRGIGAQHRGDSERAAACYEECLALMREVGDRSGIAVALANLGVLAHDQGNLEQAAAHYEEALVILRQVGNRMHIAVCLANLGVVARRRGELARAEALGREGLALSRDVGDRRTCAEELEHLACTAGLAGQERRAARLLGAAAGLRDAIGVPQPANERADMERDVAAARAALGEAVWVAAFAAGRAIASDDAIAEALGEGAG